VRRKTRVFFKRVPGRGIKTVQQVKDTVAALVAIEKEGGISDSALDKKKKKLRLRNLGQ